MPAPDFSHPAPPADWPAPTGAAAWSTLEVAAARGRSRLVRCHSVPPLKLLQPATGSAACHVVQASYGGGLVAGDVIRLRLRGQAGSRLLLGTQANTRVFHSPAGHWAEQHLLAELADEALAVVFPDPVVLLPRSRYRQVQHWHLDAGATLLLVDWFQAGRAPGPAALAAGPAAPAFTDLHAELRVSVAGRLVVLDRFAFAPTAHSAAAPANFGRHQSFFSAFLIGPPAGPRFQQLAAALAGQQLPGRGSPHFRLPGAGVVVALTQARENVHVLRAAAASRQELQPLCEGLMAALAGPDLLGFNPLRRKY